MLSFLQKRLQMQHAVLDLLGAALIPELGADITAGAAGNVQLVLDVYKRQAPALQQAGSLIHLFCGAAIDDTGVIALLQHQFQQAARCV